MPNYVDGFVMPIPRKHLARYRKVANVACKVWREHGALDYIECVGDDLANQWGRSFPSIAKAKASDIVVFSWIVYRSKAHRNAVNKKVMGDPRMAGMMDESKSIFNPKVMAYGGFKVIVKA
jgi:uncharacterized protein YbaA (DUF1428 family)